MTRWISFRVVSLQSITIAALFFADLPGVGIAQAQSLGGLLGGAGGGAIPGVGTATKGNVAGILTYCVKNKLLGGSAGAPSVLTKLTGKPAVTSSPDYKAGLTGMLLGGAKPKPTDTSSTTSLLGGLTGAGNSGKGLSLDSLPSGMRNQVCGAVLSRAKSFI